MIVQIFYPSWDTPLTRSMINFEIQVLSCITALVSSDMKENLMSAITLEEVEKVVFQMKKGKAPGPDGFPIEFFQEFWDIIKLDLLAVAQES